MKQFFKKKVTAIFCLTVMLIGASCENDKEIMPSSNLVIDNATLTRTSSSSNLPFLKGADLSYANELEDVGVVFKEDSIVKDPYELMNSYGANLVRLRLWHNPTWTSYSTLKDVKKSIKRAKRLNMYVLLDFHYSDTWTDPEQNKVPAAWLNVVNNTNSLADSVYNYTYNTLVSLKASSCLPELVQIGNETNKNIMVSDNSLLEPVNYTRNTQLFNAGLNAVKDFNNNYKKKIKTVLHVAMNPADALNWIANLKANNIEPFDVLGVSYYPQWQSYTPAELGTFAATLLSRYNIKLLVAETGHIWTRTWNDNSQNLMSKMAPGYPEKPCPQLQKDFLVEVKENVRNNGGLGVVAWEPEWVSANNITLWGVGSNWENVAFFNFHNELLKHGGIEFYAENNVKVTFKIDMTNAGIDKKGYITGEFTADGNGNWQIFPMQRVNNSNIYTFSTYLTQGQSGAYHFLSDSIWSARETVPQNERGKWDDRLYNVITSGTSQTISNSWTY